MIVLNSFGQHLRQIRQLKGIGLNEFAKELGVSPAYLSNLETGKTQTIQLEVLNKLQNELQIFVATEEFQSDVIQMRIERITCLLKELYGSDSSAAEYLMTMVEQGFELFNESSNSSKIH